MGTSNLAKAGFCFVQPMVRIACHAGVALGNLSRPMKPQMDLDDEEEPMPQLAEEAKTLRASYYCIDAARSHNRLAHQQHLRNLKQFMKEHTEDELLQQVIEKRLAQFDEIDAKAKAPKAPPRSPSASRGEAKRSTWSVTERETPRSEHKKSTWGFPTFSRK
ncbi:unnamed protein product [Durusdinium trenchii]|uniref:Uncharacterized protein n=1 Tax=Durusdinium trenchii TaxID=1381693 RepID=A0ABP0SXY4_9DINO